MQIVVLQADDDTLQVIQLSAPTSLTLPTCAVAGYDQLDTGFAAEVFGIPALRQALISAAYGDVLEVAVGTGINLPLYNRHKVQSLVGVDLSQDMLQQAASKSSSSKGLDIVLQQGTTGLWTTVADLSP